MSQYQQKFNYLCRTVVSYTLMTTSHNRRCWNTLYLYKKDLILVLCGWGASTITYITLQVRNQENLLPPPRLRDPAHVRLRLHPYAHQPQWKMLNRIIYVWSTTTKTARTSTYQVGVASLWPLAMVICVWSRSHMSMKWVGRLNHIPQHDTRRNRVNHLLLLPLRPAL